MDVTLDRDDVAETFPPLRAGPTSIEFDVTGAMIVLVDDVLFKGRTIRAALDQIIDFGRPAKIELAVLDYGGISEAAFWEGYGSGRDEAASAMIRRQFYLLYEVQKYMPIRVWRRNNPAAAERYKQQSFELAAQLLPR